MQYLLFRDLGDYYISRKSIAFARYADDGIREIAQNLSKGAYLNLDVDLVHVNRRPDAS